MTINNQLQYLKLKSLEEVQHKIKQMKIENFEAIKILNRYINVYLQGQENVQVIIPFPEMKKDIYVNLQADPKQNVVMFKHLEE